jgi:hypothetical protein
MAQDDKRKDAGRNKVEAVRKQPIVCDPEAAREAMEQRYSRFEALSCHFGHGIVYGLAAHNKHESTIPFPPASPSEILASLADAIVNFLNRDEADVDHLYALIRRRLDPEDDLEWL